MRLTEFWRRMNKAFGPEYAESVARDQVLRELGGRSVDQALQEGADAKDVWRAVADHFQLPARER